MKRSGWLLLLILVGGRLFAGELKDKAYAYENWYQRWHSGGYGGTADAVFSDPELTRLKQLDGIGDSTMWTGTYLAAEAFRYSVEKSPEALKNAKKAYRALQYHLLATGKTGLLSRYVGPLKPPFWLGSEEDCLQNENCHIISCPEDAGFSPKEKCLWLGDVSRDQYTGYWFGTALAYDLIDDAELRDWIRKDVRVIIDQWIQDGYRIIDVDGKPTGAGQVGPPLRFDWLLIASHILEDQKLKQKYEGEVARSRLYNTVSSDRHFNLYFEYFAFNLDHQTYYNLIRLEDDPARKKYLQKVFQEKTYSYTRNSDNVFFDYIAMAVLDEQWPETLKADERVLKVFPAPPNRLIEVKIEPKPVRERSVKLCKLNYNLVKGLCRLGLEKSETLPGDLIYFVPVSREFQKFENQPKEDFIWQRPPNKLADVYPEDFSCAEMNKAHQEKICTDPGFGIPRVPEELKKGYKVYPGVDYLAAYWMGRYYGFLDPNH